MPSTRAADAGIWDYRRPRTKGLAGDAAGGINRGVAVAGDRVFMVTDNAHILALDRFTGALLWDTEMADSRQNYGATSAPLAVGSLVISGSSGGDEGARGFLAAFDQATGKEAWRFWTVPQPRRARVRDLARHGHRSSVRDGVAHRDLRRRCSTPSSGRRATPAPTTTARSAGATTSTPTRSSPSIPGRAG